jgi:diaminohydroxyphosphoribosylaminopyrimidine deaminase/5-amino-6-(5-phosphoribosylamino)uracil reductase
MVGAVVAKDGAILGEGFYTWDGLHHAEVLALRQAGTAAKGATVYTSMEPCSTSGRTPPCAQALIDAGVSRVVTAMQDPNPAIHGNGVAMLRNAGVEVVCGLLEREARTMNEAFVTQMIRKRPFGVLKVAMSLDGKVAVRTGESKWITSEDSRVEVQQLRHAVDAVVTGSGTFLKDSPQMTDRSGRPRRRELLRVVLDRRARISPQPGWLILRGSLDDFRAEMASRQIQSFMLECGPDLAFNALQAGIIDKIVVFIAPRLLGGREVPAIGGAGVASLADAVPLHDMAVTPIGPDAMISAYVHRDH